MKLSIPNLRKFFRRLGLPGSLPLVCLVLVIVLAVLLRIRQPIAHPNIGEIDVYYWALRTQQFELHGFHGIGTSLWFLPIVMSVLHRIFGGDLYTLFLWTGPIMSGIFPVIAMYLVAKEVTASRAAGLFGALVFSISPIVFYRSVFTVSETFAYILVPTVLYFSIRLSRKKDFKTYVFLVVSFVFALYTHDSAKLLFLPAAVGAGIFFWKTRNTVLTKITFVVSVLSIAVMLLRDPSIIGGIKFFLNTTIKNNSAFGNFSPVEYSQYVTVLPFLFSAFMFFGLLFGIWYRRRSWVQLVQTALFATPILFYQQVLPRMTGLTIVPARLTPFLLFVAVPFFALSVYGWLSITKKIPTIQMFLVGVVVLIQLLRVSIPTFPLSYITSIDEQQSLKKIPLVGDDYVIAQTGMIGMTSLATKTYEANYYGDSTDRIFGATSAEDVRRRIKIFIDETQSTPTGVLISKWKLDNRDPYYGWWDSLVNPAINVEVFRSAGLPVRFEDKNIVLFNIPQNF